MRRFGSVAPCTVDVEMDRPESSPNGFNQLGGARVVACGKTGGMAGARPSNLDFPDFHDERRVFGPHMVRANQGTGLLTNGTEGLKLCAKFGGFGARDAEAFFSVAVFDDNPTISRNSDIEVWTNTRTHAEPGPSRHSDGFLRSRRLRGRTANPEEEARKG